MYQNGFKPNKTFFKQKFISTYITVLYSTYNPSQFDIKKNTCWQNNFIFIPDRTFIFLKQWFIVHCTGTFPKRNILKGVTIWERKLPGTFPPFIRGNSCQVAVWQNCMCEAQPQASPPTGGAPIKCCYSTPGYSSYWWCTYKVLLLNPRLFLLLVVHL